MGCSSSCKTFEIFSTAVEWIAQHKFNIDKLLHLLDDFLLIAATHTQCRSNLDRFLNLCATLGIPIAPEKTCSPATTLTFAGIEFDSIKSQARLPADKLEKYVDTIASFLNRKKLTLKDLQSLIGLLKDIGNGFFYWLSLFTLVILIRICILFGMKIIRFGVKSE